MQIHTRIVLSLGILALVSAGCETSPGSVALTTGASSFATTANLSPNPLLLSRLAGGRCAFGSAFGTSFRLRLTAGVHDLTFDSLTLHLLDGTNVGGPSVTIPSVEAAVRPASLFIRAGTTRDFPLRADFGCLAGRPQSFRGNVLLFDPLGTRHTMTIEGSVR